MTTRTDAKTSFGTALMVIVLAGSLALWINAQGKGTPAREDTQDNVSFEVTFSPTARKTGTIHVVTVTEGVVLHDDNPEVAPWQKSDWIPRGAKVTLTATQEGGGVLQCFIHHHGKIVADNTTEVAGGKVACVYRSMG